MSNKVWKVQASFYESLRRNPVSARILKAENEAARSLLEQISPDQIKRILDIGPGRGNSLSLLHSLRAQVFGLDITKKMIIKTRSDYRRVLFLQGDAVTLPIEDTSINFVICLGVIEYIKNQKAAFLEVSRVLLPGGYALISLPRNNLLNYLRKLLGHRLYISVPDIIEVILPELNLELIAKQTTLLQNQVLLRKPVVLKTHK